VEVKRGGGGQGKSGAGHQKGKDKGGKWTCVSGQLEDDQKEEKSEILTTQSKA